MEAIDQMARFLSADTKVVAASMVWLVATMRGLMWAKSQP
jgi:hypothetical protein